MALERRGTTDLDEVEPKVRRIVNNVRRNGDRALRRYAVRWDNLAGDEPVRVPEADLVMKLGRILLRNCRTPSLRPQAIFAVTANGRNREWRREIRPGVCVGQLVRPLESVGCYVPGGRYPLPSTLLMTVIPALVAGVPEIRHLSATCASNFSRRRFSRGARILQGRRSAGSRCARLWNERFRASTNRGRETGT